MVTCMPATPEVGGPRTPVSSEGAGDVALEISNVWKRFGSLTANAGISLRVHKGEVVALLGENGAGKTTLMNILYGHYMPDEGEILAFGHPLKHGSPHAALQSGIGMVHQHFTLAENLSVLDNVILGTEPTWSLWLDRKRAERRLHELMEKTGLRVDPSALVGELSVGEAQRVEILKALYRGVELLILDEPTAVLTPQEADDLFEMIRTLVEQGLGVIFISHKLREVMTVSDRCVVLRAGRVVGDFNTSEIGADRLADLMVGDTITQPERRTGGAGEILLRVEDLGVEERGRKLLDACNLEIRKGEIVAVAGVSGNGQNILFESLAGMRWPTSGRITLDGLAIETLTPRRAVELGIARIPEDRHATGLVTEMSLWENTISERYRTPDFSRRGFVRHGAALAHTEELIERFDVRCPGPNALAGILSGGNMQKVLLGRNLWWSPRLILANQPTRGLDVGAVAFVHDQLHKAQERGAAVLLISEDLDEIYAVADSIVVMASGRLSEPLAPGGVSVEQLGLMMAGQI